MADRRTFLKQLGAGMLLAAPSLSTPLQAAAEQDSNESMGWKPHPLKQGDGRGGWIVRPAEYNLLHRRTGRYLFPYGLAVMDNGEIALSAAWHNGKSEDVSAWMPVMAFSRDTGRTWTDIQEIEGGAGRPVLFTYLGKGNLTFQTDLVKPVMQYFSSDYGRTWPERRQLQLLSNGEPFNDEGNALVDRDASGIATSIAQIGYYYEKDKKWPKDPAIGCLRWSSDGGRTWTKEDAPSIWRWQESHDGKTYTRGVSEGSLIRAKNGWLVAALRTDIPARYLEVRNEDSLEGTGISISKDDGKTWSAVHVLYDAGRHHADLRRFPNGDLLMTLIVRDDVQNKELASYRRGCEALISRDNGLNWDVAHKYILDDYEFYDGKNWQNGECGHLCSAILDDGSVLTTYGKYLTKGASLIRWKPAARS